jgi:hypothetical protein
MTGERETMQLIRKAIRQGRLKAPTLITCWESPGAGTSSPSIASTLAVPRPASCASPAGFTG